MKLLRAFTMIAALASATTVFAEAPAQPPAPAKDAKPAPPAGDEISAAEAEKFLAFFNKFVDAIVQNKDCNKMAGAINGVIDANKALIKKANEMKASNKKLPKAIEEKMMTRIKEMMPAMQKCGSDAKVQAAMKRMDEKPADAKAPPPAAPKK